MRKIISNEDVRMYLELSNSENWKFRNYVATRRNTPKFILMKLAKDKNEKVKINAFSNPNISDYLLNENKSIEQNLRKAIKKNKLIKKFEHMFFNFIFSWVILFTIFELVGLRYFFNSIVLEGIFLILIYCVVSKMKKQYELVKPQSEEQKIFLTKYYENNFYSEEELIEVFKDEKYFIDIDLLDVRLKK